MADLKQALAAKEAAKEPEVAVAEKKAPEVPAAEYVGFPRILNDFASPIKKIGEGYYPKDEAEVAIMEYHVKMGNVTKV